MASAGTGAVVVRLELGGTVSCVRIDADGLSREFPLAAGTVGMFRGDPPLEAEIETAIDRVEEAVMPLAKLLPKGAILVAGDAATRAVAALAAGSNGARGASLEAVEGLFEQLAMSARRRVWADGERMDSSMAAGVLILREFMQHLGFDRIEP